MTQTFLLPVITSTGHTAQIAGTFSFSDGPNGHIVFGQMSDIAVGGTPVGGVLDSGVATLVAGKVTVSSTMAATTNPILLSYYSVDGTQATVAYGTIIAATSFVITSSNPTDTNKVSWSIVG